MQQPPRNILLDRVGRFLGLADSAIRGPHPQDNYQIFLGLHFGFSLSESVDKVTQEFLGST